jgi:hypothetical protein
MELKTTGRLIARFYEMIKPKVPDRHPAHKPFCEFIDRMLFKSKCNLFERRVIRNNRIALWESYRAQYDKENPQ